MFHLIAGLLRAVVRPRTTSGRVLLVLGISALFFLISSVPRASAFTIPQDQATECSVSEQVFSSWKTELESQFPGENFDQAFFGGTLGGGDSADNYRVVTAETLEFKIHESAPGMSGPFEWTGEINEYIKPYGSVIADWSQYGDATLADDPNDFDCIYFADNVTYGPGWPEGTPPRFPAYSTGSYTPPPDEPEEPEEIDPDEQFAKYMSIAISVGVTAVIISAFRYKGSA